MLLTKKKKIKIEINIITRVIYKSKICFMKTN